MRTIAGVFAFSLLLAGAAGLAFSAAELPEEKKQAPAASSGGNVVEPGGGGAFVPGYKKQEAAPQPAAAPTGGAEDAAAGAKEGGKAPALDQAMPPIERAKVTPKGELKNPYAATDEAAVAEGKALYFSFSCNGCHGGGGGGGMCPALTNQIWIYGDDDDTLFRLIAVGTDALQEDGYKRKRRENVVGPMMPFGELIKTDQEVWKILAFVRSVHPDAKK